MVKVDTSQMASLPSESSPNRHYEMNFEMGSDKPVQRVQTLEQSQIAMLMNDARNTDRQESSQGNNTKCNESQLSLFVKRRTQSRTTIQASGADPKSFTIPGFQSKKAINNTPPRGGSLTPKPTKNDNLDEIIIGSNSLPESPEVNSNKVL